MEIDTIIRRISAEKIAGESMSEVVRGVKIRRIGAITAADAWHVEKGFRAMRMCQAFVWDRERGRVLVLDSNVGVER